MKKTGKIAGSLSAQALLATAMAVGALCQNPAWGQSRFWSQYTGAGSAAFDAGNYVEAEQAWSHALEESEKLPLDDPRRGMSIVNLSRAYVKLKKTDKAEALLTNALASRKPGAQDSGEIASAYAAILATTGRESEAKQVATRYGVSIAPAAAPSSEQKTDSAKADWTNYRGAGAWTQGLERYTSSMRSGNSQQAANVAEGMLKCIDTGGHGAADLPATLDNLIRAYYACGKLKEAEPVYNRYLMMLNRTSGPESQAMASALANYAALCRKIGHNDIADNAEARARAISANLARASQPASGSSQKTGWLASGSTPSAQAVHAPSARPSAQPSGGEGNVQEMTEEQFVQMMQMPPTTPVFIDFYAPWCGPCRRMMPIVADLSQRYGGRMSFYRINTDNAPNLSSTYDISGIPTFIIFKAGAVAFRATGGMEAEVLTQAIEQNL